MNKETKCALCSYRSIHNGNCLVDNKGCEFNPNGYCKIFVEELEKLKEEVENLCFIMYSMDGKTMFDIIKSDIVYRINKHIEELKGEKTMSMSCFDCHDFMDGYNRGKKEGTIEELETIKAEMQKRCDEFRWDNDDIVSEALIKIVDNHISELKGD